MTSVNNRKEYSEIEAALRRHHNKIHENESRRTSHADAPRRFGRGTGRGGGQGFGSGRFGSKRQATSFPARSTSRNKHHRFKKRAGFFAAGRDQSDEDDDARGPDVLSQDTEEDDAGSEPGESGSDDDAEDNKGFVAVSTFNDEEDTPTSDDVHVLLQHDIVCAFYAAGADLRSEQDCDVIASAYDNEYYALMTRVDAREKGVKTGSLAHDYKPPTSEFSLRERNKHVEPVSYTHLTLPTILRV